MDFFSGAKNLNSLCTRPKVIQIILLGWSRAFSLVA